MMIPFVIGFDLHAIAHHCDKSSSSVKARPRRHDDRDLGTVGDFEIGAGLGQRGAYST